MTYNCPKCRCGCLFEDHGRLVCLNCGAETTKGVARQVRHTHHYQTYTAKKAGTAERPKTVKQQPRQTFQSAQAPRPAPGPAPKPASTVRRPAQKSGKTGSGKTILIAVVLIIFFVNFLVPLLEDAFDRPAPQPESYTDGVLYWVAEGEVSDGEAAILDDLVLEYNLEHDVPDMDEVHDYLTERVEEMPFGSWSVGDDGDGDVCLTVYP